MIVCESALELECAKILLTDPRVKHVQDQPPSVTYVRPDGTHHRHTFDFLATLTDGQRVAIAVKPAAKIESSGIQKTVALIEQQSKGALADRFIVRTEQHLTRDRAFNASWLLRARRSRNAADVHRMRHTVSGIRGSISMGDLVRFSGLGARGWDALVHLIDEGTVELVRLVRFSDTALVRHHPTKRIQEAANA
ncbi:TnsA endonuclease N-terminal domain-containing protein [Nitrospirillum sp. BR 11164]|uniref:TnsA endonuclease N-terminal domain-containing protein n=1 Tax=Nitrospirillum sp. BR 11164 TaxID=3104324 RepID=UPI002AFF34ED|nr:TnsA endonuclease N-terminal domain-containing protein [Nitrospirillum sp. BR 11164]MEA1653026.1 TnsA endonuclease N-terminal domain-containing protein [Nitrospirillum sp. BR 11164]